MLQGWSSETTLRCWALSRSNQCSPTPISICWHWYYSGVAAVKQLLVLTIAQLWVYCKSKHRNLLLQDMLGHVLGLASLPSYLMMLPFSKYLSCWQYRQYIFLQHIAALGSITFYYGFSFFFKLNLLPYHSDVLWSRHETSYKVAAFRCQK